MKISNERAMALPATLFMMLIIAAVTAIISTIAREGLEQISVSDDTQKTFFVAEGAANGMMSQLALYGSLWDKQAYLGTKPYGYTTYAPSTYSSTNGIPTCSGIGCQRNMVPTGGGLIKNFGPLGEDGSDVDSSYVVFEQLNLDDLQDPDVTLSDLEGWNQLERLDESPPGIDNVGGNLSSSLAEGGNAKSVRFRITATSRKELKGRVGYATVVFIVKMKIS